MSEEINILVDRFVEKVNAGYRDPISVDIYETPPSVLVGEPDDFNFQDWLIRPYSNVDWVYPLEEKLGHGFPLAYRSLVSRYIFPGFEAGDIMFYGNTPEGTEYFELRNRIFCDQPLYAGLSARGFIQFGKNETACYDPICFDINRESDGDCPIVRIDHESILCANVIKIVYEIAPSFRVYLEDFIYDKPHS
jgi:hypothetical protein